MYFDTHAHLNADNFRNNLSNIIEEARSVKVDYINVVGFNPKTNDRAIKIATKYENIFATCGLHPTEVQNFTEDNINTLEEYLAIDKTVAIGECGLDYYWHKETKIRQIFFFERQIDLAKKYQKPIIVHVRDAFNDSYDVLKKATNDGKLKGVMHCFSGSKEMALRFIDLGFYISLGGPVTFKNAKVPKEVAKIVPLDRLMIETDCPYLAPHPYRGKENKPSYLPLIAKEIAEIKNVSLDEIAYHTTNNAKKLFNIR